MNPFITEWQLTIQDPRLQGEVHELLANTKW